MLLKSQSFQSFMHEINNIEMAECRVFGKRAKNSRCIHGTASEALHQSRTQSMPVRRLGPAPNLRTGILWVRDWHQRRLDQ